MNSPLILLGALALILAVAAALGWHTLRRRGRGGVPLDETLETSRNLFELVVNLQQHRGLSSGWLAGDASFAPRLREKQTAIEALMPRLLQDARGETQRPAPCFTSNDVSLFAFRWRSLIDSLQGKTPEQSIAEHSQLIGQLINWLSAVGEARIAAVVRPEQAGCVRNYAYRLPALAECLGQMRAIGSSVAARRACSPVARVRLLFLLGRVDSLLNQAVRAAAAGMATGQAQNAIAELTRLVRQRLLVTAAVDMSPEQYFKAATLAVDSVVAWVGECANVLRTSAPMSGRSARRSGLVTRVVVS